MDIHTDIEPRTTYGYVTVLTYAMFFMFAMTTDAVGEIIKIAKGEMGLTNMQASAFHWATMIAIAGSGIFLGFLADLYGRKRTIILGLVMYGLASALFFLGESFYAYLILLFVSGIAVGIFKTAALALIGDITQSTEQHTRKMNAVEGFFGIGAIVGPLLVVFLSSRGISWTWLYLFAAGLCVLMIAVALKTEYPVMQENKGKPTNFLRTFGMLKNKYALGFSFAIAMYVASEVAIFVWLPTLLTGYTGTQITMFVATYAVMIFFIFRAAGRFLGIWILNLFSWTSVMLIFSLMVFGCFLGSAIMGQTAAVFLLPMSGLFMSMIYPTLNSKGISCFPKAEHGAIAGLILFFTAAAAAIGPLLMAFVADQFGGGDMTVGFYIATGFSGLLFLSMLYNYIKNPAATILQKANVSQNGD
ncbi:MAG: MFS transporter [Alphaproteobacteria bacterium]|nr:MAG: MFS transporter [Alphaproteobacteria bacterium]